MQKGGPRRAKKGKRLQVGMRRNTNGTWNEGARQRLITPRRAVAKQVARIRGFANARWRSVGENRRKLNSFNAREMQLKVSREFAWTSLINAAIPRGNLL